MSRAEPLRAPQEEGGVLARPSLDEVPALVARNRQLLADSQWSLAGPSLAELRRLAQREVVQAAQAYLGAEASVADLTGRSLLLTGHQPELFHPGVWIKNFALHGLARRCEALPLHLIVDNDTVKRTALLVPDVRVPLPPLDAHQPSLRAVPFDVWRGEIPYEEYTVQDEELFARFPERAKLDWGYTPLLASFWSEVRHQRERTPLLGERFAAVRRTIERRWGVRNLELPISRLCQTEAFAWFVTQLLREAPRLHTLYNLAVLAYRFRHGLRSKHHPVPELAVQDDWYEVPLWAWRQGETRRGRLFVRRRGDRIELRSDATPWPSVRADDVAALRALATQGCKIRSRALTNTLFARVFVGDLFIHGIGGGKYDELTDELIRGFYGLEPPGYLVLTATLRLPLPRYAGDLQTQRTLAHSVRDLHWNPQRLLPSTDTMVRRKQELIAWKPGNSGEKREHFEALRAVTEQLRPQVATASIKVVQGLERVEQAVKANEILRRRDYAYCLFPEEMLRAFLGTVAR